MNKLRIILLCLLNGTILMAQGSSDIAARTEAILSSLTLDEKIKLLGGNRIFYTNAIPEKGISPVLFSDATQGIALRPSPIYKKWKKPLQKTIAYPAPILLASTWNTELAYKYARAIGQECNAGGIGVLLGPGLNMYRVSQCGRNFEYFGEDPFLVSRMIENYVKGVQSTGTIATLKHFLANNSDYYRRKSNSVIGERALHEIYLPPFKAGIEAGAGAVMTSYNLFNGEWCGQSSYVIHDLLREQLGFQGLVMTDWWSVNDGKKLIKSGQDLEMPYRKALKDAKKWVEDGTISENEIDRMLLSQIKTFLKWGSYDLVPYKLSASDVRNHEKLAIETAQNGIVLLKNDNNLLPIDTSTQSEILVTGPFADKNAYGTGAARVKGYDQITIGNVLQNSSIKHLKFNSEPDDSDIKSAGLVMVFAGTTDGEGKDSPFELPEKQEELIRRCVQMNENTVVFISSGRGVRMTNWYEKAAAILYTWYYGQNGAFALFDILTGNINPSGKLPITIEKEFEDGPAPAYLPDGEELYSRYSMNKEKKEEVFDVVYEEGIFTGYRWYDKMQIMPLFPFGHGLSYTRFSFSDLKLSGHVFEQKDTIRIGFRIKNSGEFAGAEVVQVYVSCKNSQIDRAEKELKAFKKIFLDKGEEAILELTIEVRDLAYWNEKDNGWSVEPGSYELKIGSSSKDIRLTGQIEIQ